MVAKLHSGARNAYNATVQLLNYATAHHMQCDALESAISVICLSPDHLRRKDSRSVSCYAIFKGWLLLSQPPDCRRILTSSSCTEHIFRDLNWRSGLFPFRPMELLPHSLTAALLLTGIRSLIRVTRFLPVYSFQCSTPSRNTRRQP